MLSQILRSPDYVQPFRWLEVHELRSRPTSSSAGLQTQSVVLSRGAEPAGTMGKAAFDDERMQVRRASKANPGAPAPCRRHPCQHPLPASTRAH